MKFWDSHPESWLQSLRELWQYRELILSFAMRDLQIRYRQTLVGIVWVVLQPVLMTGLLSLMLGLLKATPVAQGDSVASTTFCGMLLWQQFATATRDGSQSLVSHRHMISKIYFPRAVLPLASVLVSLVDLLIASSLLLVLIPAFQIPVSPRMLLFPAFAVLGAIVSASVAVWLGSLNALYRDVGYVVPFLLQLGLFCSAVFYVSQEVIPPSWWIFYINPMVTVIEGGRWALLGTASPPAIAFGLCTLTTVMLVWSGTYFLRLLDTQIADRI